MTALFCTVLLLQAYRRSRYRLLLWGGLCFLGLTINNALLIVDRIVLPYVNLFTLRLATALVAMLILLHGLIWEAE
jgi:hypothetical protein